MRRFVLSTGFALLVSAVLAGCGGSSTKTNNAVTQITATPTTLSINSGDVASPSFIAENSANTPVAANLTFTSSNTNVATVSNAGAVCGGQWDATFVVCTGVIGGVPVQGTATITATAGGVTSPGITVSVHPRISSVVLTGGFPGCTSSTQGRNLDPTIIHVCSTQGTPDAGPPCGPAARDITSIAGTPQFASTDTSVVTISTDIANLAVAHNPGNAGIFANLAGVSSPTTNFRTCMPKLLVLHLASDPAGTNTTTATMTAAQTLTVKADMIDENGVGISPAPVSLVSNNPVVATAGGTSVTAVNAGGAGIVAACVAPVCGNNTKTPIYSDIFQVTVSGTTPAATVYVTSSFAPPTGTAPVATPVNSQTGVASAPIGLSGAPNSMIFAKGGARAFLGTSGGLATLDPVANTEVTSDLGLVGAVIGVSQDGATALISNAVNDPSTGTPIEPTPSKQRLFVFSQSNGQIQTLVLPGATSATFSPDGFKAYVTTNTGNFYVFSPAFSVLTKPAGIASAANVAFLGSNNFAYFSGGSAPAPFSVCDDNPSPLPAIAPAPGPSQLVGTINNTNQIVSVNSTGLDILTAGVVPPASGICPPTATYTNAPVNFGIGAFTARQLLVASNGSRVVVIPVGINKILTAVPGGAVTIITLPAGATEGLSGALTSDGNTLWLGVGGVNTLDKIDLTTGTDVQQIANTFKKSDGSPAPPNIVALQPK